MCLKKLFQKWLFFISNQKITSKLVKLHMRYLIVKFMVQKRMPEKFCFVDLIRNFMVFIEPKLNLIKILEMSKNFQFFCDIAEKLYSRNTILPFKTCHIFFVAGWDLKFASKCLLVFYHLEEISKNSSHFIKYSIRKNSNKNKKNSSISLKMSLSFISTMKR